MTLRQLTGLTLSIGLLAGAAWTIWLGLIRPNRHRCRIERLDSGLIAVHCECGRTMIGGPLLADDMVACHRDEVRGLVGEVGE